MTGWSWLLLDLLIFTNWCWYVTFKSYRNVIIKELKRRGIGKKQ